MLPAAFISGSRGFTLHFHFCCSVRATFDGHFYLFRTCKLWRGWVTRLRSIRHEKNFLPESRTDTNP